VQLQDEKLQLEKKQQRLNRELGNLKKLKAEQEKTIGKLEDKLERTSKANEENDRLLYWGQRFQKLVDSWMDQKSQKDKKEVVSRFIGILNQRSSETEKEEKKTISKIQSKRDKRINELKNEEVAVGDRVKILDNGFIGSIAEIKRDKFLITMGNNITTWADRDQFIKAEAKLDRVPKRKKRKKSFNKKPDGKNQPQSKSKGQKPPKKNKRAAGKKDSPK
jgi:DNA mismatch repair protein MutS2